MYFTVPAHFQKWNLVEYINWNASLLVNKIIYTYSSFIYTITSEIQVASSFQVEAAYDMLLMQSLNQRRSGKVANSNIRYADVKPVGSPVAGALPQWLKSTVKNVPISIESPSPDTLGIQAGVYGALMVLTFVNGVSTNSAGAYSGADVPGLILATSFGASIYFMRKKSINLGKCHFCPVYPIYLFTVPLIMFYELLVKLVEDCTNCNFHASFFGSVEYNIIAMIDGLRRSQYLWLG